MSNDQTLKTAFFYGLFMDEDLLKNKGLHPVDTKLAHVTGYSLWIGERATLERNLNKRVYGTVMKLVAENLDKLYSEKSLEDYVPLEMFATDRDGNTIEVVSYILPMEKVSGSNSEYAKSLAGTARKLGLPGDYIDEIETWI